MRRVFAEPMGTTVRRTAGPRGAASRTPGGATMSGTEDDPGIPDAAGAADAAGPVAAASSRAVPGRTPDPALRPARRDGGPGRPIDDHFTAYGELSNGGKCLVRASQICIGHKNDLGIVIAGTKGGLRWRQEEPEQVTILLPDQPDRIYWRGAVSPNDGFLGEVQKGHRCDQLEEAGIRCRLGRGFGDASGEVGEGALRHHRAVERDAFTNVHQVG